MSINILKFCEKSEARNLHKPFNYPDKTIATNGFIAIFCPLDPQYEARTTNEKIEQLIELATNAAYINAENIQISYPDKITCQYCAGLGKSTAIKCQECEGSGLVEFDNDYHDYEIECKSCDTEGVILKKGGNDSCGGCDGTGYFYPINSSMRVINAKINPVYYDLIKDLPDLQIANIIYRNALHLAFRSGDYIGIIMGMQD